MRAFGLVLLLVASAMCASQKKPKKMKETFNEPKVENPLSDRPPVPITSFVNPAAPKFGGGLSTYPAPKILAGKFGGYGGGHGGYGGVAYPYSGVYRAPNQVYYPGGSQAYYPSAHSYPTAQPYYPSTHSYPAVQPYYPSAYSYPTAQPYYPSAHSYPAVQPYYPSAYPYHAAQPYYPSAQSYPTAQPYYPSAHSYPTAQPYYSSAHSYPTVQSYYPSAHSYPATQPYYPSASYPTAQPVAPVRKTVKPVFHVASSPAVPIAAPASDIKAEPAPGQYAAEPSHVIVKQTQYNNIDGSFSSSYETDHGIVVDSSGFLKKAGTPEEAQVIQGSYTYYSPEGILFTTTYIADENGFRVLGDHLPSPPAQPQPIAKAHDYQRSFPTSAVDRQEAVKNS